MTVPATLLEAEALTFARQWIARAQEVIADLGGAPLDPITDHAVARWWCKLCAQAHPQGAEQVVDLAVSYGERSAHEALVRADR